MKIDQCFLNRSGRLAGPHVWPSFESIGDWEPQRRAKLLRTAVSWLCGLRTLGRLGLGQAPEQLPEFSRGIWHLDMLIEAIADAAQILSETIKLRTRVFI